jgi:hypothetical protein
MLLPAKLRISQKSSKIWFKHTSCLVMIGFLGLTITGCSSPSKAPPPDPGIQLMALEHRLKDEHETERGRWLAEKEAQQQEIERLQKLVAEKETQIRGQQARQQDQAKTLQETATQAAQAQIKLRRLATRPAAASAIAETEIFMESLKPATNVEQSLQSQAQRLLQAATTSYAEGSYAAAMDQAAQAHEFAEMVKNNRTRKADQTAISLQTPIPLRAAANSNLRQNPSLQAVVLAILKKDSTVTAEAYQGDWFKVQTSDGESGWVLNTLVEAYVAKP